MKKYTNNFFPKSELSYMQSRNYTNLIKRLKIITILRVKFKVLFIYQSKTIDNTIDFLNTLSLLIFYT